jgi:single-strand DNA-binding protein
MSRRSADAAPVHTGAIDELLNEVRLRGRVSADPVVRVLPSGDEIVTLRVVVGRPDGRSDALEATAWTAGLRRRLVAWKAGDVVEIEGALRRRFWRTPQGAASRWDIEINAGRRVQRA